LLVNIMVPLTISQTWIALI